MKNTNRIMKALIGGLAGIVASTGCAFSEFNPAFRPNEISSTHKQRGLFDFGQKIEGLYNSGDKWTLEDKTNTLYVRAENFTEALDHYNIKNSGSYNELFEGARVEITFDNPRTGQEVTETQIVANDGTIDSKYFGSFDAFATRTKLDEAVTARAREKFGKEDMEVGVKHVSYPFAERSEVFLGFGAVNSYHGGAKILPVAGQPLKAQFAILAGDTYDTKYAALIKHATNEATVTTDDPNFVSRVVIYGLTGNFVAGLYDDVNFGNNDYLVGLGNKPWANTRALLSEFGGLFNDISGASDAIQGAHESLDRFSRGNYLEGNTIQEESGVQKAGRVLGEVQGVTGSAAGIKGDLNSIKE